MDTNYSYRVHKKFLKRIAEINALTFRPSDEELLDLYGAYKQATVGDNVTAEPYSIQFKTHAKWTAWNKFKGMSTTDAEFSYIETANKILKK